MSARVMRAALAVLVVVGGSTGLWATLSPRSFYDGFPGGGRAWVSADGPYNEHLIRDFGSLNLALAVVSLVALLTLGRAVVTAAALAWIAYGLPHLVYHARHLDVYTSSDKVLTITSLTLALALPVIVLVAGLRRAPT